MYDTPASRITPPEAVDKSDGNTETARRRIPVTVSPRESLRYSLRASFDTLIDKIGDGGGGGGGRERAERGRMHKILRLENVMESYLEGELERNIMQMDGTLTLMVFITLTKANDSFLPYQRAS